MHIVRRTLLIAAAVALLGSGATRRAAADGTPASAESLMSQASASAKRHKLPVLVMFHASWCGWCKKLDAVMSIPEFQKMFQRNYVLVTLDVMENGDKQTTLENPGGKDLMAKLGGAKSGLPFYAFLNADGAKLADSNAMPKDMNIGYPGEPAEIDAFIGLIKKTAPHWSASDLNKLKEYLVKNAPSAAGAAH